MNRLGDLADVLLEEPERVRVGQHQTRHLVVERFAQGSHVHHPRSSEGTSTVSYPASVTDAGLVPWAESGIRMTRRGSPWARVPVAR